MLHVSQLHSETAYTAVTYIYETEIRIYYVDANHVRYL
jgi:hypothetical protein